MFLKRLLVIQVATYLIYKFSDKVNTPIKDRIMTQYNVKGRYTDDRGRSHNFQLISDLSDRRYIEQLVRAKYPAKNVYINIVNQAL